MTIKRCCTCKKNKPLSNFGLNKSIKDGLQSRCRDCRSMEDRRSFNKRYGNKNRLRLRKCSKKWRQENPDKVSAYHKEYQKKRREGDLQYRLRGNLRARLRMAIRQKNRGGSAIRDLGCSVAELLGRLESQFSEGMSWDNYGECWEIDHIIPLASWDLTDPEQCGKACHYSNLRPMLVQENRGRKSE